MSLSIGNSGSKFVTVYNLTVRPSFSTKVVFADLSVSKKTGKMKVDKETGEAVTNENGEPIPERVYQRFKAKFVGKGAEKIMESAFADGTAIDIIEGWLEREDYVTKNGDKKKEIYCIISNYELSSVNKE